LQNNTRENYAFLDAIMSLQKKESIVKGQHASNVFRAKEVLSRRRGANTHAHPAPRAHTTPELAS
jgi:hypothetical protein